jgi:hypothetical protein
MTVSTASHSFDLELHHLSSTIYTKLDAITLKLNPLYDQLIDLRFRSLSYLADECGVDVTPYC